MSDLTDQADPIRPAPAVPPMPVRLAVWSTTAGFALWIPLLFVGRAGWIALAIGSAGMSALGVVTLFNLYGAREWQRAYLARMREQYHWSLNPGRRLRGWYPMFMQRTWFLLAVGALTALLGAFLTLVGLSLAVR